MKIKENLEQLSRNEFIKAGGIVLGGSVGLLASGIGGFILGSKYSESELQPEIDKCNGTVNDKNTTISAQETEMSLRGTDIAVRDTQIANREAEIGNLQATAGQGNIEIIELRQAVGQRDAVIKNLQDQLTVYQSQPTPIEATPCPTRENFDAGLLVLRNILSNHGLSIQLDGSLLLNGQGEEYVFLGVKVNSCDVIINFGRRCYSTKTRPDKDTEPPTDDGTPEPPEEQNVFRNILYVFKKLRNHGR